MRWFSNSLRLLIIIVLSLGLFGCEKNTENEQNNKYYDMIDLINSIDSFSSSSQYFQIDKDIVSQGDGKYRYYVIIDKPKVAMYDIEAIAIEKDVDYSKTMAANVGVFEQTSYALIPNQTNSSKNYMSGVVISGISENKDVELYLLVQWKNQDLSIVNREYLKLNISFIEDYYDEGVLGE